MIAGAIAVLLASARVIARYRLVTCEVCFVDLFCFVFIHAHNKQTKNVSSAVLC